MPAAAVIPAPIAYIKVVAVKKLVVGFLSPHSGRLCLWPVCYSGFGGILAGGPRGVPPSRLRLHPFTVKKLECLKQAFALNTLAWNNKIGLWCYFVGLRTIVMINRDSWGYSYLIVRGEILGFMKDELLRKHLPRMFSLIMNES